MDSNAQRLRSASLPAAALLAFQLCFIVWTRCSQPMIYVDDAFIHYRNSLHFAQGMGLIYNAGEWIIGTTSPVYASLLGLLHAATRIPLPELARLFNTLADGGIVIISLAWLRRAGVALLFRHAIVLVCSAEFLRMFFSSGGMELSFFILAILGVFESLHRGRWLAAGLILGVIGWIRPEGAIVWLIAPLSLAAAGRRRELTRLLAVAVSAATIFACALFFTYHAVIPFSLVAKSRAPWFTAPEGYTGLDFFLRLGTLFPLNGLTGHVAVRASQANLIASNLLSLMVVILIAIGARRLAGDPRSKPMAWALAGFLLLYDLFYTILNPQIFFWYYIPLLWAALMLMGVGAWGLCDALARRVGASRPAIEKAILAAGASVWLLLCLPTASLNAAATPDQWHYVAGNPLRALAFVNAGFDETTRERRYFHAAQWVNRMTAGKGDVEIACTEIGIFGYYSKDRILDLAGLVSPRALAVAQPEMREKVPPDSRGYPLDIIMTCRPDIVMVAAEFKIAMTSSFGRVYELAPGGIPLIDVYIRKDRKDLSANALP